MINSFNAKDHFWRIDDQIWSSRAAAYVAADDERYVAFLARDGQPTRIRNEFELQDTLLRLAPAGAMSKTFTPAEALEALAFIDEGAVLQAFGVETLAEVVPDAQTLVALRDQLGLSAVAIA